MDKIKKEIIELAGRVFQEEIPTRNIYVSRTDKASGVNRKGYNLYQGSLFSNNLKELARGRLSSDHYGALHALLKAVRAVRRQQFDKMVDNNSLI